MPGLRQDISRSSEGTQPAECVCVGGGRQESMWLRPEPGPSRPHAHPRCLPCAAPAAGAAGARCAVNVCEDPNKHAASEVCSPRAWVAVSTASAPGPETNGGQSHPQRPARRGGGWGNNPERAARAPHRPPGQTRRGDAAQDAGGGGRGGRLPCVQTLWVGLAVLPCQPQGPQAAHGLSQPRSGCSGRGCHRLGRPRAGAGPPAAPAWCPAGRGHSRAPVGHMQPPDGGHWATRGRCVNGATSLQ